MSEYFRPSKIWAGKLCYVEVETGARKICLPCRIARIINHVRIEVLVIGSDDAHIADINRIYDRSDGPALFHDVPGGRP